MMQGAIAIRVVIIDDDPFVQTSLKTILSAQDDIEVLATGGSGSEAIRLFDELGRAVDGYPEAGNRRAFRRARHPRRACGCAHCLPHDVFG